MTIDDARENSFHAQHCIREAAHAVGADEFEPDCVGHVGAIFELAGGDEAPAGVPAHEEFVEEFQGALVAHGRHREIHEPVIVSCDDVVIVLHFADEAFDAGLQFDPLRVVFHHGEQRLGFGVIDRGVTLIEEFEIVYRFSHVGGR